MRVSIKLRVSSNCSAFSDFKLILTTLLKEFTCTLLSYNTLNDVLKNKHKYITFNYSFNLWQNSAN